jgi:predicted ATPase/class 3 adenylate cyclase
MASASSKEVHHAHVAAELPAGTVTFLFTDVAGSTKLLQELGAEAYAETLAEHRRVIREAIAAHGGVEVDTQGDAFFAAFPTAPGALSAAVAAHDALAGGPIRVRMGLHSGQPLVTEEGYVGLDVHRAARIAAAGHGGQILVSASTAADAGERRLRSLGLHRLKDLSAPDRLYQLGDEEFPRLKTLHQTNLPIPATPFLGREKEIPEVLQYLARADVRLLTLTGAGGTGKTRLAAQAAALASEEYPDGVWWVPLAALRDPELVLATTAQVLGAKDDVADHIADKTLLLLLDNFEQVIAAGADVAQLLATCPNLNVLVTSRERLHVTGEQEYPVRPFVHEEGVGFFISRALSVAPDFEPDESVSEICRRLDNLPLALELAAARVKALSPQQILGRLEQRWPLLTGGAQDLPERQRTLRATIEWSYELLAAQGQELFVELGVFRGGCTIEAAEAVADADLDSLQSLVDKSLLRHTRERYWMLETIREFAAERVSDELRRYHAEYFIGLAKEAHPNLRGDPGEWLERLDREQDNFRAALDWLEATGQMQLALDLCAKVGLFWYQRGLYTEGVRRLERVLSADNRRSATRAEALRVGARLWALAGEPERTIASAEEALDLHTELGDEMGAADAAFLIGAYVSELGQFERARDALEESLERFRDLGDDHYTLLTKVNLAWIWGELGDYERATALSEESLAEACATGNKRMEALARQFLAMLMLHREGATDEALELLHHGYRLHVEIGELGMIYDTLSRFAKFLAVGERFEDATRVLATSYALQEQLGGRRMSFVVRRDEKTQAALHAALDDEMFGRAWDEGALLTSDQAVELALRDSSFAE